MAYSTSELKRKLRDIKRLETQLRFMGDCQRAKGKLIWDDFFSIKPGVSVRYQLDDLAKLDRDSLKEVLSEYFYFVYYQIYREKGLTIDSMFDPGLLSLLGLPPFASATDIKTRFREMAKKYHPDMGGDSEKFIALMGVYEQLTKRK
jgi:hypothetical protein